MEELIEIASETTDLGIAGFGELIKHFAFNMVSVMIIIHFFYYRKSRRKDYYFTFTLISLSIFMMIFLLGSVKLKIGFALGLFAIFGIIRYRTESMPVREMTYLFVIIAMSVINALALSMSYLELTAANVLFIVVVWLCESNRWLKHVATKLVMYDRIDLIHTDKRKEMMDDLEKRTGLTIYNVEVGSIDFLRDSAMIKIYYEPTESGANSVDCMTKLPKEEV